jgi:hypothetical protein
VLLGPSDPEAWVLDITRSGSCDAMTSYREFEGLVAALHDQRMISVSVSHQADVDSASFVGAL